jgi:hypothetical protein
MALVPKLHEESQWSPSSTLGENLPSGHAMFPKSSSSDLVSSPTPGRKTWTGTLVRVVFATDGTRILLEQTLLACNLRGYLCQDVPVVLREASCGIRELFLASSSTPFRLPYWRPVC